MTEATCEYSEVKGLFRRTARMCGRKAGWRLLERTSPPWDTIPVCGEHAKSVYDSRQPEARIDWRVKGPTERDVQDILRAGLKGEPAPEGSRAAYEVAKVEMRIKLRETLKYDHTDESSVLDAARQIVGEGTLFVVRTTGGFAIDYEPEPDNGRCVMVTAERVAFIGDR